MLWTPPQDTSGTVAAFSVRAWDGALPSTTPVAVQIQVAPTNDPPDITAVAINNGATSTTTRTATLSLSVDRNPTPYLASESSTFTGASWAPYSSVPAFILSPGNGTKTVYVKVRNGEGESPARSDSIVLIEDGLSLMRVAVNKGAPSATSRSVVINLAATGTPTEYLASESPTFTGATWQPYSSTAPSTLSLGLGRKNVYVKLRTMPRVPSPVPAVTLSCSRTMVPH